MRDATRVEFEWVFRRAYRSVLRTVFVVLHDQGRAEEVTQDAFLRLYERWRGVAGIDHPEAWVRQVAVRLAIKQAKWNRAQPVVTLVDDTSTGDRLPDVDLARAVAALPAQQRAARRSPSSGRPTTRRGARSRCRPGGGRTGCSWPPVRTWTRTCVGSSC